PTAPSNLVASNPTSSTIDLNWTASTDNVGVTSYDIYLDEVNTYTTANATYVVTGLASETNYCFTVYARDAAGNTSTVSNQDCETTTATGSGTIDLFFSEYVEGSGTNKALEIANFTGGSVALSNYTLRLATNGNSFGSDIDFPINAEIFDQDVYVIANTGLLSACQPQQDYVNNTITGFNGNDAIGLYKNGTLIDIIGTEGSSSDFAKDVTLIRKPAVEFPTTTFNINEWTIEAQNDCSNLGTHNQTLSIQENSFNNIHFFPNPLNGNKLYINTNETIKVEIYNVLGKRIIFSEANPNMNSLDVSKLSNGIYLVKIGNGKQSITKKLIKH
ncbi:MAG: T9SS type A sorting domain-containing protein, partial [Bacteroidia bacterium]|nr:T9SS type A sorting domain-containing protein [Bacteroidia bacterium]